MQLMALYDRSTVTTRLVVCGASVLLHVLAFSALHIGMRQNVNTPPPLVLMAQIISADPEPVPVRAVPRPAVPSPAHRDVVQPTSPLVQTPVAPRAVVQEASAPAPLNAGAPMAEASAAPHVPTSSAAPGAAPASHTPAVPVRVSAALAASGTCQKPEYPALSLRRQEEGVVQLKFLIGVDGRVLESQIEQSSGYARLDEAARAALARCAFKAGTVDGKQEPSWARLKYTWQLE